MNISDIIRVPFGYLLDWLYQFTTNYGLALILFSLIVKLVLLPMNAKSKKSMLKMSRIAPLQKALEAKYADDKAKYQQEVMALYKEEGVSTTGGCLWSFIPLLILWPLYYVIREPITYMMHIPAETAAQIVEVIKSHVDLGSNTYFHQLIAASHIGEYLPEILEKLPDLTTAGLQTIDFSFLGIDLSQIPNWKFWSLTDWNAIGAFLLPILSGGSNILAMWVSQKLNNSVATNDKGEQDKDAAKMAQSMNTMLFVMPLISVWIGFTMPAAVTVYWIAQSVFSLIIDSWLTVRYRKIYAAEDEVRREKAAKLAAEEAERERLRAARRAANPDGITENTSKKKQERKEREEREAAQREFAARKAGIDPDAPKAVDPEKCPSGIPDRPYCRGRAYDPNRYKRNASDSDAAE
ncbi:MAG TPA: YidC/Oxa1 family membrane protein insertase [Candidatus Avoscillospira avicola]|uniref:YidC/Oxa1 family membrane protein insertase n=1 Tax=Candidatus Avoscillospira avicola TaxID=2840706 RepID=A0A9D1IWF4_9FIRM|nr:YidC/Oxa1 family membrane protein insertase [Candidatus Avoscillospira avicola]